MMRRSVMVLAVVALTVALALPSMAQGGPPPGPPPGGPTPGAPGMPGMGPGGPGGPGMMQGGMNNMMSSPPVLVVAGDFVYVAWMGTLSVYKAADLTLVKSVTLPMPERMRGMGRDGAGRGQGAPGGPHPAGGLPAPN